MQELVEWNNFYVIVGSAAGALVGLQFVVMTLIASMSSIRADPQASDAFATPSVVHFCAVLLVSAIFSAPWHGIRIMSIAWGLVGLAGVTYAFIVARRLRRQTAYSPVFEDWLFHGVFPVVAYLLLAASACFVHPYPRPSLFAVGVSALALLFIGIHNAWDAVTYHVFILKKKEREVEG